MEIQRGKRKGTSKKAELLSDLKRIGSDLGGAHLTRDARAITFSTFVRVMRKQNFGIERAGQIGGRHLDAFVAKRLEEAFHAGPWPTS